MKKTISLLLLSVYVAFVAGTLFSASEDATLIYHTSEFKGKYHSSSDDGVSYLAEHADIKKIQKHLPFYGKVKLTRPEFSNDVFKSTSLANVKFSLTPAAISAKAAHSSLSLYLTNRTLLI